MKTSLVIALVLVARAARAEEEPPRHTVSVGLAGLVYRGVAAEIERDLPAHGVSVAAGLQLRSTAGGDYDSSTLGVAAEVRRWFLRRRGAPVRWYAGARLDLATTRVTDAMDETIGVQHGAALSVLGGYRFAPWRGLEIRPYAGIAWRREWGDGLAAWGRGGLVAGVAAGWSW